MTICPNDKINDTLEIKKLKFNDKINMFITSKL